MNQKYLPAFLQAMTIIKELNDINQVNFRYGSSSLHMMFSKTFGYALRGVLYVAMQSDEKKRIQLDEIAEKLSVSRHFLGNVMKKLVKAGVLNSMKGPYGGFCVNDKTKKLTLFRLKEITGEVEDVDVCVLRLRKCNSANPCPMHNQVESLREKWQQLLASTTIDQLLMNSHPDFIKSISVI